MEYLLIALFIYASYLSIESMCMWHTGTFFHTGEAEVTRRNVRTAAPAAIHPATKLRLRRE